MKRAERKSGDFLVNFAENYIDANCIVNFVNYTGRRNGLGCATAGTAVSTRESVEPIAGFGDRRPGGREWKTERQSVSS